MTKSSLFRVITCISIAAAAFSLAACGSSASDAVDPPSSGDVSAVCLQVTGAADCGIRAGGAESPSTNELPANKVPSGQAASILHLYFGEFYMLVQGKKYVYDGVAGTITMTPGSGDQNSGTFQIQESFTQGFSMAYTFLGSGQYTYSPTSDVYEFQFQSDQFIFGGGTLTAANGQLIGTLTRDGSTGTTFAIPYTTE